MNRPSAPSPISELSERSREIFRLIVDGYVQTGEPIGSRTLSRLLGQHLSPATIRNVMADLEEAGMLTQQFQPEAIILDYKLPDVDGNRVCRTIRSNPQFTGTKIIIISGVADPDEIAELRSAGADEFLKKPFQIDELITRLLQLLSA